MFNKFSKFSPFAVPTAGEIRARQLSEAERELALAEVQLEAWQSQVTMLKGRCKRLQAHKTNQA